MKASSVLVQLDGPIRNAPPEMRRGVLQFLYDWCHGADDRHDKRWRLLWHRLYNSLEARPSLQLWIGVDRSRPFHVHWMTFEQELFSSQDGFYNLGGFRNWLKTGAAFGHYEAGFGALVFVPSSLNWEDCSDDEMREFTADAMEFLHSPAALATLWPVVAEADRPAMLQACIHHHTEEPHD